MLVPSTCGVTQSQSLFLSTLSVKGKNYHLMQGCSFVSSRGYLAWREPLTHKTCTLTNPFCTLSCRQILLKLDGVYLCDLIFDLLNFSFHLFQFRFGVRNFSFLQRFQLNMKINTIMPHKGHILFYHYTTTHKLHLWFTCEACVAVAGSSFEHPEFCICSRVL